MYTQNRNNIERHVKTHSQRSDEDRSAVTILETFLRANGKITFTIDIEVILTEMDCQGQDFELVDVFDNSSRISLTVYAYDDNTSDLEDSSRMNSIVPFQLAYAVSIHKAQGLEYDSVKVIIPQSNSEKITHGIFYTAITRAKKKLKIYWSAETMKEIVSGFATNESNGKSLEIVKAKLAVTQ